MGEWIISNTSTCIGIDKSLVEISLLVWSKDGATTGCATKHQAEETMECNEIRAKCIIGIFGINDFW